MPTRAEYAELLNSLLEQGMDREEAENFLVRGNQVHSVNLFLPPRKLEGTLQALKKLAIIPDVTKVQFMFSLNRYDEFVKVAEEAAGQKIVHGDLKPGEKVN